MNLSKIQWTDRTWNPVRGCSHVSEGCRNCYAETIASRFSGEGMPFHGFAKDGKWTGRVELIPEKLEEPLHWKRPCRIFVNSMSDLFHENLDTESIASIFWIMERASQHTFQILTKRPEIMHHILSHPGACMLQNVWLGVSVEDQKTADERIPLLLQTPAAVRFVSYEPALEAVDFQYSAFNGADPLRAMEGLDWLIIGGESGPNARPFDLSWVRSAIRQCHKANVPVFVKQLGSGHVLSDGYRLRDPKGGDPADWPEDLRIREFPK